MLSHDRLLMIPHWADRRHYSFTVQGSYYLAQVNRLKLIAAVASSASRPRYLNNYMYVSMHFLVRSMPYQNHEAS
jgi:hypothetical protein